MERGGGAMKYLLIICISCVIGTSLGTILVTNNSHQLDIDQAKSVKVDKTRYFFVGYTINNRTKDIDGNIQWFCYDGLLPNNAEVCKHLQNNLKGIYFTVEQFAIVGLYEFKNKSESDQYYSQ